MEDEQAQNTQAPVETKSKRNIPKATIALVLLSVLLLATSCFLFISWQGTKATLKSNKALLSEASTELQKTKLQLLSLRDDARKTDVASFVGVIRAYNTKNKTHLTTEGTISKQIYDTELSKAAGDFKDPLTGKVYGYVAVAPAQSPPPLAVSTLQYQWPGVCGTKALEDTKDTTQSAVATLLEDGTMYCVPI